MALTRQSRVLSGGAADEGVETDGCGEEEAEDALDDVEGGVGASAEDSEDSRRDADAAGEGFEAVRAVESWSSVEEVEAAVDGSVGASICFLEGRGGNSLREGS